jgi:hypothetical protein
MTTSLSRGSETLGTHQIHHVAYPRAAGNWPVGGWRFGRILRRFEDVTGEWTVFWEVALIVLLFVAIGGVLAMPALDGIRVRVDDDQLSRPERRR